MPVLTHHKVELQITHFLYYYELFHEHLTPRYDNWYMCEYQNKIIWQGSLLIAEIRWGSNRPNPREINKVITTPVVAGVGIHPSKRYVHHIITLIKDSIGRVLRVVDAYYKAIDFNNPLSHVSLLT